MKRSQMAINENSHFTPRKGAGFYGHKIRFGSLHSMIRSYLSGATLWTMVAGNLKLIQPLLTTVALFKQNSNTLCNYCDYHMLQRVTWKHWLPVHGPPYGPGTWTTSRTGPRTPFSDPSPQKKIAQKENKQKWQKDLTYHLNGLTASVGENSNICFHKINRLMRKVILHVITYFAVAMYERPKE